MADERQRIDKWLWFARVVKSRTLGQKLATSGQVRVNRERNDSASRLLKAGDTLTIAAHDRVRVLRVVSPGTRRGPAAEAQLLYEDLTPPADPAERALTDAGPDYGKRPDRRGRQALRALRNKGDNDIPDSSD